MRCKVASILTVTCQLFSSLAAAPVNGVVDKLIIDNVRGADNHDCGQVKFGLDGSVPSDNPFTGS